MRLIFLGVLVTASLLVVSSSSIQGGTFEVGPTIGINGTGIWGEESDEWGSKSGICLGGLAAYNINSFFAVQGELLYSQKGARQEDSGTGETTTLKIDYLEIPVLAKLSTVGGGTFCCVPLPGGRRTSLYLGPTLGFKLSSSIETESEGQSAEEDADVKSFDIGLAIGVSTGYGSEKLFVFADFRFTMGLMSAYSEPSGSSWSNYAGYMGLGMAFGL